MLLSGVGFTVKNAFEYSKFFCKKMLLNVVSFAVQKCFWVPQVCNKKMLLSGVSFARLYASEWREFHWKICFWVAWVLLENTLLSGVSFTVKYAFEWSEFRPIDWYDLDDLDYQRRLTWRELLGLFWYDRLTSDQIQRTPCIDIKLDILYDVNDSMSIYIHGTLWMS